MSTKKETTAPIEAEPVVDEQEYEIAVKEAENSPNAYTHEFPTPFSFEGESFDKLSFDFGTLTAQDSLSIEAELQATGRPVIVPEFSGDYLLRMAMRACTTRKSNGMKLGLDFFQKLPLSAYVKIRGKARSFLLRAGS